MIIDTLKLPETYYDNNIGNIYTILNKKQISISDLTNESFLINDFLNPHFKISNFIRRKFISYNNLMSNEEFKNAKTRFDYTGLINNINTKRKNVYYMQVSSFLTADKGLILDNLNNILFNVSVSNNYIPDYIDYIKNKKKVLDYSQFTMYVSSNFINDDVYTNIYKRVYKDIISVLLKKGVNFSIKSQYDLEMLFYRDNFIPKFKTINELNKFLTEDAIMLLNNNDNIVQSNDYISPF